MSNVKNHSEEWLSGSLRLSSQRSFLSPRIAGASLLIGLNGKYILTKAVNNVK